MNNVIPIKSRPKKPYREVSQHERAQEKSRMADAYKREHPEAIIEVTDYAERFIAYPATISEIIARACDDIPENALVKVAATTVLTGIIDATLRNKRAQGVLIWTPNNSRSKSGGVYDLPPDHKAGVKKPPATRPSKVVQSPPVADPVEARLAKLEAGFPILEGKLDTILQVVQGRLAPTT
jgi:hypothetical protein